MGDSRDLLDRAAGRLELRPHGWERLLELAHRRQRRRRLFAGALALVLSATSGAGLWTAFHGTTQTAGGGSNHEALVRLDQAILSADSVLQRIRLELQRDAESRHATEADMNRLERQLATIGSGVKQARVLVQIQSDTVRLAELRAHIRQLHDELTRAAGRLASLKVRKAELTFPPSIYPAPASFPPWGNPGGCPSLGGVEPPGLGATAQVLPHLSRLGTESIVTDLSLTDRASWPVVRSNWSNEGLPGRVRTLTAADVVSGPAARSPYAGLVRGNCGQRTLDLSWWAAVCPVGTRPCSLRDAPALTEHFLLVDRRGSWLVWFANP